MSLRTSRHTGLALSLALFLSLVLGACATGSRQPAPSADQPVVTVPATHPAAAVQVQPWEVITGGAMGSNAFTGMAQTRFRRPVAVAALNNVLYVVDADQELLFEYDRLSGRLTVLKELRGVTTGEVADIYVARDRSFYLADVQASRVLYFDRDGHLVKTYADTMNLSRPVAISVDEASGDVYVADGGFDHVLVFNRAGKLLRTVAGRGLGQGEFLNITSMARAANGFVITSRLGLRGQALDSDGRFLYALQENSLVFPMGVALDSGGRVYAGDFFDNTIKVYEQGRLRMTVGGTGVVPGRFKGIADLAIEGSFLYVADSLNGRIQVLNLDQLATVAAPASGQ